MQLCLSTVWEGQGRGGEGDISGEGCLSGATMPRLGTVSQSPRREESA